MDSPFVNLVQGVEEGLWLWKSIEFFVDGQLWSVILTHEDLSEVHFSHCLVNFLYIFDWIVL